MRFQKLLLTLLFFFSWHSLLAQSTNGKISGLVVDPTGGVIAGAELLVIDDVTGIKASTTTNSEGIYVFPNLPPGPYRLQVSRPGFKTLIKPDIVLNVQGALSINFTLPVGAVSDSVTVQGGASMVNTADGTVATVVDRQFVENIPLNGRSFQSLIELTPGVVAVPGGSNSSGQFSVDGQRPSANNFTVDGVSANFGANPGTFGAAANSGNTPGFTTLGTTQSLASVDALQEFKVQTSTYAAEYGRQPGGQISIVTRAGTNAFHGSAFEYLRNDVFDANNWFADNAYQPKPAERQNDFGGTFGGPVMIPGLYNGHDRTFFFFSYEGLRLRQPQFTLTDVPDMQLRQQAAPGIQPILNAFPVPNGIDLGNGFAEFTSGYSVPSNLDATSIRIDHMVSDKWTLFARYNLAPSETINRGEFSVLSGIQPNRLRAQTITLGATALLTNHDSNDIRVNYSGNGAYLNFALDNLGGAVPPARSALIPTQYDSNTAQGGVAFILPGLTSIPFVNIENNGVTSQRYFNFVDGFSHVSGSHQLKVGIDYRRLTPTFASNLYHVEADFFSLQEVLSGRASVGLVSSGLPMKPVFLNFSAYGQDTWKVSPRLSLDFGLRWEVNPAPSEANGKLPIAVNEITDLASMQLAPLGTKEWRTTYGNFAPRFGAAYQLSQRSGWETVFRGGFGVFYDTGNDIAAINFNLRFPYSAQRSQSVSFPLVPSQVAPPPAAIQTGITPPYPSFLGIFDPALNLPYTLHSNVSLEQGLGKNQALTLSYVAAEGRRLIQTTQLNLRSINPDFTTVYLSRGDATSDYDALQAQFQRRLSRGLQALVSYTWSHSLDEDSMSLSTFAAQRGNAAFDIRHVLSMAATYEVPAPNNAFGSILRHWFVDTSFHAQSALPVDLVASVVTDPNDGAQVDVRPNVVPGVPFYIADPSAPGGREINRAAFQVPPSGQSGDFGRNQVRGLGAWEQDFALRREFPLYENLRLQFRAEAFNIFNHPNFGTIQTLLSAPNFGQATNILSAQLGGISPLYQIGGPRSLQLALKIVF